MSGKKCVPCPSRAETSSATPGLIVSTTLLFLLYMLLTGWYLSRNAISIKQSKKVNVALRRTTAFQKHLDADDMLNKKEFQHIMSTKMSKCWNPIQSLD